MYTLYGFPKTRSVRVAWALEELGLDYQYQLVNLRAGEHLSAQFRTLNPAAKIPLLVTEDGPLAESAAIVTYLAEKHGMEEFIPKPGTYRRGCFEQMMHFLVTELEQPLWSMAKHDFALPEQYRIKAMQDTALWEFERALKAFSQMLGDSEFVCGDLFTVADIVAGQLLAWAKGASAPIGIENVVAYSNRVLSRPAYESAWKNETAHLPASL
ncbi:glutathione S-transferase family protein [Alteromonas antoniana]|uniref:glutathione S-transferase family protein n=1 Tax=Alteromonas antoniana TaxID=2803813 RepID=UPI001C443123|nr:glutathione S-transferase family protein [Alteromonas antoniana]